MLTFDGQIVGADGIPWCAPSQILATNSCVCKYVCVCVFNSFVWYLLEQHGKFLPVITADITGHSKFVQRHTDHFKSLRAGDCIDPRK